MKKKAGRAKLREQRAAWYEVNRLGLYPATQKDGYTMLTCQGRTISVPHYQVIRALGGQKEASLEQAFGLLQPYEGRPTWGRTLTQQSAKCKGKSSGGILTRWKKALSSLWHNGMGIWHDLG